MKRIDFSELPAGDAEATKQPRIDDFTTARGSHRRPASRLFIPPDPSTYHHVDAYTRHVHFINTYVLNYVGNADAETLQKQQQLGYKTDRDILREEHRFVWQPSDEEGLTWEKRLAKRYYDKLYKEYAIADLSRYKENKIALRWRTQKEVIDGKGQFTCGARKCSARVGLQSWEVNFGYEEHGERRNTLVKVRLCPDCSARLNYRSQRRKAKAKARSKSDDKAGGNEKEKGKDKDQPGDSPARGEEAGTNASKNIWGVSKDDKDDEQLQEEAFDKYFDDLFM